MVILDRQQIGLRASNQRCAAFASTFRAMPVAAGVVADLLSAGRIRNATHAHPAPRYGTVRWPT